MNSFMLGAIIDRLNTGDILFQVGVFLLLVFLLKKYAWGPLSGVMREREEFISNQIDSAENDRKDAAAILEEQRSLLKQAREEALANIEASRKAGEDERKRIVEAARVEAEKMSEAAKQEIENQKDQALKSLREYTGQLSVAVASKLLARELNVNDQQKLVDDLLREVGEKNE